MVLGLTSVPASAEHGVDSVSVSTASPTAEITGGTLSLGTLTTANFDGVILDGAKQTTTSAVTNMTLIDARGSGAGWSVNLTATAFTNSISANIAQNTLRANSVVVEAVTIAAGTGSTPVTNITKATGPIDAVGGVTILNAGVNEGMGTYSITFLVTTSTSIPKQANAGSYVSTIMMTLSQGPVA